MEDDDRSPWSLPQDTRNHQAWRPETESRGQREGEWAQLTDEQADWSLAQPLQAEPELYSRQDVFRMPDEHDEFQADPYQLQVPPDGLYDWQPESLRDPSCPQHGYQQYGFAGYPGYQDSQGYQTALSSPLYEHQQDSDIFSDSQPAFPTDDDGLNICPLGSGMCTSLDHGFPTCPPIEDDDDDHPPGSQGTE
ncbi:uncharacterized protein LOC126336191 [Schistocerca gregaria]|uniref:uncharacterized protein LOC126336191 n=1 Tax=Schistocerca gregaria TaxID=7010 RepID=UPI00211F1B4C|nr:uncharacterized protein LOC126336191 [Schistocerca gregaria]XP_049855655.1 uncharacterized protein LOC126336191 [Schistocerca gregaria]